MRKGQKHSLKTIEKIRKTKTGISIWGGNRNTPWMANNTNGFKKGQTSWCKGTKGVMKKNSGSFKKGQKPWNKDKKIPEMSGNKHWNWRGNNIGYFPMHRWVIKEKGSASGYLCKCGKQALDWANIDHKYKRNLDDYRAMCRSCHMKFDKEFNIKNLQ